MYDLIDLGTLPGQDTIKVLPQAININGEIAGYIETVTGDSKAFIWKDGEMTEIISLSGPNIQAIDINDFGKVTGWFDFAGGGDTHAFVYDVTNGVQDIGNNLGIEPISVGSGINNAGTVVGWYSQYSGSDPKHAYSYESINGLNDLGTINVGGFGGKWCGKHKQ